MKSINIVAEFQDPAKTLKASLSDRGARNISLHPTCDGWLSVRYEMKVADPQHEIIQLIEKSGAKLVHLAINSCGAKFDFRIDDKLDEREFKRQMIDQLQSAGYRAK